MTSVAAARPTVSVFNQEDSNKVEKTVPLPDVFLSPIRPDIVNFVHTQINKNNRQAYAVKHHAGMEYAAESWGTGRAVSRIPRVPGGGTHRAGQGAFGNMCRGGRMFAPTKIWRKWHRKVTKGQKRYAVCSALAASAVPALVMAKGHRVGNIPELPLVIKIGDIEKTKQAVKICKEFGVDEDLEKAEVSKKVRPGKGKARNRRYKQKKGPMIVHDLESKEGLALAFRALPGVDIEHVDSLNLLKLAPGGQVGRLIIWTESAFNKLNAVFGTKETPSLKKKGFVLPRSMMSNADLTRIINSDEIQKAIEPTKDVPNKVAKKVNPLKNKEEMNKLNPYAETMKRKRLEFEGDKKRQEALKKEKKDASSKEKRRNFYKQMIAE